MNELSHLETLTTCT